MRAQHKRRTLDKLPIDKHAPHATAGELYGRCILEQIYLFDAHEKGPNEVQEKEPTRLGTSPFLSTLAPQLRSVYVSDIPHRQGTSHENESLHESQTVRVHHGIRATIRASDPMDLAKRRRHEKTRRRGPNHGPTGETRRRRCLGYRRRITRERLYRVPPRPPLNSPGAVLENPIAAVGEVVIEVVSAVVVHDDYPLVDRPLRSGDAPRRD